MIDSSWLSRSFSLAYTEWHDALVHDATLRIKSYLWSARKAEKREIHVNYLPDDLKWSVFNLQEWNRAHLIGPFVNLCQPLSTLHLPLHQHLHHGFKLGLCWPLLPIHQTKARTDFNNLLFVPLPIWDNNGHLALRQCKTNYIVGVFNWSTLRKSNAQR